MLSWVIMVCLLRLAGGEEAPQGENGTVEFYHWMYPQGLGDCCTQLPGAWITQESYTTPRKAFESGNCFLDCDENPFCPPASVQWVPGTCQSQGRGTKHGTCTGKDDSHCCTEWCNTLIANLV
eukprot:TRINITY_DN21538_c0_g1_i1.p2 TRINITY_DN21538_c0_g1~~TRINITY_DN21538_c0_g1_i1.p2  ORF type:complete len:123 (-),score=23.09 TRINITY_DN21538_c0_g1_i1:118-486(-)